MKILLLMGLMNTSTFAADLNLNGGESAVIQANVNTRVTCGGGANHPGSCASQVDALKYIITTCAPSFGTTACLEKYWPSFKVQNPACVSSAIPFCVETCKPALGTSYCLDKCVN